MKSRAGIRNVLFLVLVSAVCFYPIPSASAQGHASASSLRFLSLPGSSHCSKSQPKLVAMGSHPLSLRCAAAPSATFRAGSLQTLSAGRWVTIARAPATPDGVFHATAALSSGRQTLRLYVSASRTAPRLVSATVSVSVVPAPSPATSFRAIYALPSDVAASAGAIAAITCDIAAADHWFSTQTNQGVQPRWLRKVNASGLLGDPTVLVVRLSHTKAQYAASADELGLLRSDLAQVAPAVVAGEKSAVWIEADSDIGCGVTDREISFLFEAACGGISPSVSDTWPFGTSYLLAHEMTHNFGAVAACAPHYDGTGHVSDDPRDVLYNGSKPRDWAHLMLDPGHDDYYDTGSASCPGIESSPFWTTLAETRD